MKATRCRRCGNFTNRTAWCTDHAPHQTPKNRDHDLHWYGYMARELVRTGKRTRWIRDGRS